MDFNAIAEELVAGCREGRAAENLDKLYAADAVSVEGAVMPGMESAETHGVEGIKGKHAWWDATFEVLEASVDGPFPHLGQSFAVIFQLKAKHKESGEVSDMKEVAIYHVSDGKITREEFYYTS